MVYSTDFPFFAINSIIIEKSKIIQYKNISIFQNKMVLDWYH